MRGYEQLIEDDGLMIDELMAGTLPGEKGDYGGAEVDGDEAAMQCEACEVECVSNVCVSVQSEHVRQCPALVGRERL